MIESIPYILTGIGIIISILYYTSVLRNTNKSREAQIFLQLSTRMADPKWMNGINEIRSFDFSNYQEFRSYYDKEENKEKWENIWYFYSMMDDLGGLIRGGYIGIALIGNTTMGPFLSGWEKLEPYIEGWREHMNSPQVGNGIEYLYNELVKYKAKHPEL